MTLETHSNHDEYDVDVHNSNSSTKTPLMNAKVEVNACASGSFPENQGPTSSSSSIGRTLRARVID